VVEVRETNLPAQLFFRALGFRATIVLRNFFDDSAEDAYVMQYSCRQARPPEAILKNRIAHLDV
jgi:ribosomal-protein-alanine N-acetyltransferase